MLYYHYVHLDTLRHKDIECTVLTCVQLAGSGKGAVKWLEILLIMYCEMYI